MRFKEEKIGEKSPQIFSENAHFLTENWQKITKFVKNRVLGVKNDEKIGKITKKLIKFTILGVKMMKIPKKSEKIIKKILLHIS